VTHLRKPLLGGPDVAVEQPGMEFDDDDPRDGL